MIEYPPPFSFEMLFNKFFTLLGFEKKFGQEMKNFQVAARAPIYKNEDQTVESSIRLVWYRYNCTYFFYTCSCLCINPELTLLKNNDWGEEVTVLP